MYRVLHPCIRTVTPAAQHGDLAKLLKPRPAGQSPGYPFFLPEYVAKPCALAYFVAFSVLVYIFSHQPPGLLFDPSRKSRPDLPLNPCLLQSQ